MPTSLSLSLKSEAHVQGESTVMYLQNMRRDRVRVMITAVQRGLAILRPKLEPCLALVPVHGVPVASDCAPRW
jgi:phosphoribosylcarboxyaminoimidazole (NCAIR) mutase